VPREWGRREVGIGGIFEEYEEYETVVDDNFFFIAVLTCKDEK